MATTLDGVTLADPIEGGGARDNVPLGEIIEHADGSIRRSTTNSTGYRKTWRPRWKGITAAQAATIEAEWQDALQGSVLWSPPDTASTYTVIADGRLTIDPSWKDGAWHYEVYGGVLLEVSP